MVKRLSAFVTFSLLVFSLSLAVSARETDFFHAVFRGDVRTYNRFKADISSTVNRDPNGRTLLIAAVAGVNEFKKSNSGTTALHLAAENNDIASARALLAGGADPNVWNEKGYIPYLIASKRGYYQLADIIYNAMERYTGRNDRNSMTFFITDNYLPIINDLIKKGFDIDAKDYQGKTALHYAVESGVVPLVQLLIENGANPNLVVEGEGQSALILAAERGYSHIVEYLVKQNVELNITYWRKDDSRDPSSSLIPETPDEIEYAKPDEYNFRMIIKSDNIRNPSDDGRCFYKIFVNKVEVGRTQIGLKSQNKVFTTMLDVNRHLITVEKYVLDETNNRYIKANNINQPNPDFVYVDIQNYRILSVELIHRPRNTNSEYNIRFLRRGE